MAHARFGALAAFSREWLSGYLPTACGPLKPGNLVSPIHREALENQRAASKVRIAFSTSNHCHCEMKNSQYKSIPT